MTCRSSLAPYSISAAGPGRGLRKSQRSGWQTYGIDPATAPMLAGEGHTMLDAMPDEPTFELIIMKHVLEHVPNPLAILRQARRSSGTTAYLRRHPVPRSPHRAPR